MNGELVIGFITRALSIPVASAGSFEVVSPTIDGIVSTAGNIFTDLGLIIVLAIGVPLGFWVIAKVIGLIRARA